MNMGSTIPPNAPDIHVESALFLTLDGIMEVHGLRRRDYLRERKYLYRMKLVDILAFRPGRLPYDIALNLIANAW